MAIGFAGTATPLQACQLIKAAELPVTMEGLTPFVSARINDLDTRLLLDSGAFYSVLDAASAKRARLKPLHGVSLQASGVGGTAMLTAGRAQRLQIADLSFEGVDFLIHERPISAFSAGVLGQNFLGVLDVEYDLAHGVVRIFKPKGCEKHNLAYWGQGMDVSMLPLRAMSPAEPHARFTVEVNGVKTTAMLDSGMGISSVRAAFAERAGVTSQSPGSKSGGLIGGVGRNLVETWSGRFEKIVIGGEQITNTRLAVSEHSASAFDMVLGADFFLAHRIFVSNSQRRIYFTYNGGPVFRLPDANAKPASAPVIAVAPPAQDTKAGQDPAVLGRRAAALSARRDYKAAIEAFSSALALSPDDPELLRGRAMAFLRWKQREQAQQDLDKALTLAPDHVQARLSRGAIRLRNKDVAGAQADFDAALKAAPHEAGLPIAIANHYADAGELDRALALFDAWVAAHPKDAFMAIVLNSRCWARTVWNRDLHLAAADCDQALKRARPNSATLNSRGMLRYRRGHWDAAIADFDASLKLQPNVAWSLYGRGLAKSRKGPPGSGAADISAALAIEPEIAEEAKRFGLEPI